MAAAAAASGGGAVEPFDAGCINCWSGPRCVSTSLMYAFAQRSDTQVRAGWAERVAAPAIAGGMLHGQHQP